MTAKAGEKHNLYEQVLVFVGGDDVSVNALQLGRWCQANAAKPVVTRAGSWLVTSAVDRALDLFVLLHKAGAFVGSYTPLQSHIKRDFVLGYLLAENGLANGYVSTYTPPLAVMRLLEEKDVEVPGLNAVADRGHTT